MRRSCLLTFLLLVGCASTGPIELSPGLYMISKSSAAGAFTDLPKLKLQVINEAKAFAAKHGKIALPVKTADNFPTHGFPSFEYQFRLVATNDPAVNNP